MTYHTLVQFDPIDEAWGIEFGDYNHQTVLEELEDYVDRDKPRGLLRIVTTEGEEQEKIEAAVAELPKLQAFTFEAADYIPRGVHITIYAEDVAGAMAEANRIVEADEIDWEDQKTWDDGCTSTQITGLWEGEEAYGNPECRPAADAIRIELEIAKEIAPAALTALGALRAKVKAYNDDLNDREIVPTTDDYNALLGIIMGQPAP